MQRSGLVGVMILAGLPLLGGCVADYKRHSEEQYNFPPELSGSCRFEWTADKAYYRVAESSGFAWASAGERGHPGLQRFLKEVPPRCFNVAGTQTVQARLSTYYLEYTDRHKRAAMMVPAAAGSLITVGFMPLKMHNYYTVCVETDTPSGPRRAALAHGMLEAVTNVWGAMESPLHSGATLRRHIKEQLLQDLTRQAWHKLWTVGEGLPAGVGCRAQLDAMLK